MKKIIIILTSFLTLTLLLLIFLAAPITFHQAIHKKFLAKSFSSEKIQFSDISFSEKTTQVSPTPESSIKVQTISNINPLNNYINVDYKNTKMDLDLNFQVYFHLQGISSITAEVKFSDEHFSQNESHIEIKDLSLFIKSFHLLDLLSVSKAQYSSVLEDKVINIVLGQMVYKLQDMGGKLEGINIELASIIDGEDLTLNFSTEIQNLLNDHLGEELGLKSTRVELEISSFEKNLALQFITTVPVKSIVSRAPPSIFEVLPYIRAIRYPLSFKLQSKSIDAGDPTHLNLDLGLATQKFLSLKSYNGKLDYKNKTKPTVALLTEAILATFPKAAARRFSLAKGTPVDKRFLERKQVQKKIKEILRRDLATKTKELLAAALEMNLITKNNNNLYLSEIALNKGAVSINGSAYKLKRAMSLPSRLLAKIYPPEDGYISNLLISNELFPIDRR